MKNHTFREQTMQSENIHNILMSRKENSKRVNPSYLALLVLAVQLVSQAHRSSWASELS